MKEKNNIVSLSGGKDSTAMLLLMIEKAEPIHSVVFFDTGWEFPQMYEHIDRLECYTGIEIVRLRPNIPFDELLIRYSWPWMQGRWCTRAKINKINAYCKKNNGIENIGFSVEEKKRTQTKEMQKKTDKVRFPLIRWGITEGKALEICYRHGFYWDGLYRHFKRVSCFCCPLKGSPNAWRKIRRYYPDQWAKMLYIDSMIENNGGFYGYKTVHDLDRRFSEEDRQIKLFYQQGAAYGAERSGQGPEGE